MGTSKNICMVVYTEYSMDPRVQREAEALVASSGKDVLVLALKENINPKSYIHEGVGIKELNIDKYRGGSKFLYLLSYFRFIMLAFIQCNRLLFRKSLDIVHVHNMPNALIFAAIIPYLCGKKIILDVHDTMPETYMAKFEGKIKDIIIKKALEIEESICCRMADKVICVNHIQQEVLINRGIPKRKMLITMNVPDPRVVKNTNIIKESPAVQGKFKMCYHGTITKRLGIDLAIQAIKRMEGKIPSFEFHIFGGGDGKEECLALAESLELQKCVNFRGSFAFEKLMPMIAGMDLGIIPNRNNQATELMLPVKMLEYMAMGIPVVVPRLRAIRYYFSDEMVFFYDSEDIESLSNTILMAYNDRALRMDKANKARKFFDMYGWEIQKKDLIKMYDNL